MKKLNFYLSIAANAWLLAAMVVVAELFKPFKDLLVGIFSHHWIGKGIIVFALFFALAYAFGNKNSILGIREEKAAWYSILGSLAVIFLFFVIEFVL